MPFIFYFYFAGKGRKPLRPLHAGEIKYNEQTTKQDRTIVRYGDKMTVVQ